MAWQQEISEVFSILQACCEIRLTSGCATHVHVSPMLGTTFNIDQLQRIIKQIIYYDSALTTIMPPDRKDNTWAESNVKVTAGWKAAYDQVPQRTWAPIFARLDGHKFVASLLLGLCQNRYVSWNFAQVLGGSGTIEFRRPPGVKTPAEANHWIAFTLGYVAHAMVLQNWSTVKLTNTYPSTNNLRNAISTGVHLLPQQSQGALRSMADINLPATVFSPQELAKINKKKQDKANTMSVFTEKVCLIIHQYTDLRVPGLIA
jgi:Putative amidoligase enzyme